MYCPECKSEYRSGFTVCSDCQVPLVETLPDDEHEEDYRFERVLSTFNSGDIAFIKSLLDGAGINFFFEGENFNLSRPATQPAVLMVQDDQVESVLELLKDVDLNYMLFDRGESDEEE